jgi:hypothetical protein
MMTETLVDIDVEAPDGIFGVNSLATTLFDVFVEILSQGSLPRPEPDALSGTVEVVQSAVWRWGRCPAEFARQDRHISNLVQASQSQYLLRKGPA